MISTKTTFKNVLLLFLVMVIGALLLFLNGQSFDLTRLQVGVAEVTQWRQNNETMFVAVFFTTYVIITATSLPFALWMTLAAGALFGLW